MIAPPDSTPSGELAKLLLEALDRADALDLNLVAIRIAEALDQLDADGRANGRLKE